MRALRASGLLVALISVTAHAAPEQISSGAATRFETLGISADGRYVLYSNPNDCTVYRKDRNTGDLLPVLESSEDGYGWCNGAAISDDGNLVAAAPVQTLPGGCDELRVDEHGNTGCFLGSLTELIIKNIATGDLTEIRRDLISQSIGDIGRIPGSGDAGIRYGVNLVTFAGDGGHAVTSSLGVASGVTAQLYRLADVSAGTSLPLNPPENGGAPLQIQQISMSDDGYRLALQATVTTPPNPPEGVDCSASGGSGGYPLPGSQDGSYWEWGSYLDPACRPAAEGPDVFIWDRLLGTLTNLTEGVSPGRLPSATAPVISGDGAHAAWFAQAEICSEIDENGSRSFGLCDENLEPCANDNCEPQIILADLSGGTSKQISVPDPETNVCARQNNPGAFGLDANLDGVADYYPPSECQLGLSDDGHRVLFARQVTYPFGGNWTPEQPALTPRLQNYTCLDRTARDAGETVFVDCPDSLVNPPGGPFLPISPYPVINSGPYTSSPLYGASFRAPLTWHTYDTASGHTTLVSIADQGQLFHANSGMLAGGGGAWAFNSRDGRLQNNTADETVLDDACFWSPPGTTANLRVSTNDSTTLGVGTEEIVVYPELPVFCSIPDPALTQHVYAAGLGDGVNLAVMTLRDWRRGRGAMQTWFGNFSNDTATLIALVLEIKGLGTGANIQLEENSSCDIYPAADSDADDTLLVRCEYGELLPFAYQQLRWTISSATPAVVTVRTSISGNEQEFRPGNNTDSDRVVMRRPLRNNWLSNRARFKR
jgi:hypothetical protein